MSASTGLRTKSETQYLSIFSFVSAAISLLFLPIIFGPIAIALGICGWNRHERLGRVATVVAVVAMIVGFALSYAVNKN